MLAELQEFAIQIYFSQLLSDDGQAKLCFVSLSLKGYVSEIPYFFFNFTVRDDAAEMILW